MNRRFAHAVLAISICLAAFAVGPALAARTPLSLDPGFGRGGVVRGAVPGVAAGVADAPGGGLIAVGVDFQRKSTVAVRHLGDGSLDPGYGEGGVADLADTVPAVPASSLESVGGISSLAVDGEGRALLLWRGSKLTRLTAAGAVDRSFGTEGTVVLSGRLAAPRLTALASLPDGRILLAGYGYGSPRFYLEQLLPDGAIDPSFGRGGIVAVAVGDRRRNAGGLKLAVGRDGKITVAGYASGRPALIRLRSDGSPDRRFGHNGRVVAPVRFRGRASALMLARHGGAVIGCRCVEPGGRSAAVLLAYGRRGKLDRRFAAASSVPVGPNGFRPTSLLAAGRWIVAVGEGRGRSIRVFGRGGRPGPTPASLGDAPANRSFGVFAAIQKGKLLVAWTPKASGGAGGKAELARFRVR